MPKVKLMQLFAKVQNPHFNIQCRDLIFKLSDDKTEEYYKNFSSIVLKLAEKAEEIEGAAHQKPVHNPQINDQDAALNFKELLPYLLNDSDGKIEVQIANEDESTNYTIEIIRMLDMSGPPNRQS